MTFDRITVSPEAMGGVPCIRGLRIPVATDVTMVADGVAVTDILDELPALTPEDVAEALRYAAPRQCVSASCRYATLHESLPTRTS